MNNVKKFEPVREHGTFVSNLISAIADANFLIYKLNENRYIGSQANYYKARHQDKLKVIMTTLQTEDYQDYINSFGSLWTHYKELEEMYSNFKNLQNE